MIRRPTTAFRLALLLASLFTLFSLLTGAVLWIGTRHEAGVEQRRAIRADARDLVVLSYQRGLDALSTEIDERVILSAGLQRWYALYAANGIRLAGNLPHRPRRTGWSSLGFTPRATSRLPTPPTHTLDLFTTRTAQHGWLVVGRDAYYLHHVRAVAGRIFAAALAFIVMISLLAGAVVGRGLSRRVRDMSAAAEAISAGDLERRMPRRHNGDELDLIAATINSMLDRIASLLADVRRMGADIAHDLRTPLTRLRQRLERLHQRATDPGVTGTSLGAALDDIDELLNVFQALLRIARVESGEMRHDLVPVDLAALLDDLHETYAAVAEAEGHRLALAATPGLRVRGDRELLMQALVNLVENGIRHTPAGTQIVVELLRESGRACLAVCDDGPGIPDAERERVLQPFLRLDRSRQTEGNGLGLALVRSVAELHEAELCVGDNRPGLRVSLRFALLPDAAPPHRAPPSLAHGAA